MDEYDAHAIERKWQAVWDDGARLRGRRTRSRRRRTSRHFYMLEMLPYPSGKPAHGARPQLHARRRDHALPPSQRHTVLRPMGFDSFGLPAENAAIKEGGDPLEITERNIASIIEQMRRMGWAIDWDREVSAHEPTYYRWTQWLFLKFLEHGLAYRKEAPVNWCPHDQTVLANEHVVDGRCWRCGSIVEIRNMAQWFFKITAYADELLDDLATIDWPERTKKIQTQLDRPLRGRRDPLPRRRARASTSRCSRRGPTRSSARRSSCSRRSRRSSTRWPRALARRGGARVRARRRGAPDRGARDSARRRASSPGATRRTRRPASRSRSGSPTTC